MKLEKQNMSLRHRIFLLLLAVGLASFIIAGAVSLAGMYAIRENIDKTGALLAVFLCCGPGGVRKTPLARNYSG